jgi:hypothetical protein
MGKIYQRNVEAMRGELKKRKGNRGWWSGEETKAHGIAQIGFHSVAATMYRYPFVEKSG